MLGCGLDSADARVEVLKAMKIHIVVFFRVKMEAARYSETHDYTAPQHRKLRLGFDWLRIESSGGLW
jgi:hypothetical protein